MNRKMCSKCFDQKLPNFFGVDNSKKDKLNVVCKQCRSDLRFIKQYEKNIETLQEEFKEAYEMKDDIKCQLCQDKKNDLDEKYAAIMHRTNF